MSKIIGKIKVVKIDTREEHTICDFCLKTIISQCGGITVSFPYGHSHDSDQGDSDFCSDTCLINFMQKNISQNGEFQSETQKTPKKLLEKYEGD